MKKTYKTNRITAILLAVIMLMLAFTIPVNAEKSVRTETIPAAKAKVISAILDSKFTVAESYQNEEGLSWSKLEVPGFNAGTYSCNYGDGRFNSKTGDVLFVSGKDFGSNQITEYLLIDLGPAAFSEYSETRSYYKSSYINSIPDNFYWPDNMVDERFELLALIARLAGNRMHTEASMPYQRSLFDKFENFKSHPAVAFAWWKNFGGSGVFNLAMNLKKDDKGNWKLVDNISSLTGSDDMGHWSSDELNKFVSLVNDFYKATKFGEFYKKNIDFYKRETLKFQSHTIAKLNMDWFKRFGEPLDTYRIFFTPSDSQNNYAAMMTEGKYTNSLNSLGCPLHVVIHEFCHTIGNPIADEWYKTNAKFKQWAVDGLKTVKGSGYWLPDNNGIMVAHEYVTRAYTILYLMENGDEQGFIPYGNIKTSADSLLDYEVKYNGFPMMKEVLELVIKYEANKGK